MPTTRLLEYLDRNQVEYVLIRHSPAYTAQTIAASAHVPGKELAKTVMVKIDGEFAMVVLPASNHIHFERLRKAAGTDDIALADEQEFLDLFPDCEVGAMPPFGNLYGMKVFVDADLTQDREIAFNAGSHRELIRLQYDDFERLVEPRLAKL